MDKNFKMGQKFEKRDLERTKSSKKGSKKCWTPLSPLLRGDPRGLVCFSTNFLYELFIYRHRTLTVIGLDADKRFGAESPAHA